jgi:TonB family protein
MSAIAELTRGNFPIGLEQAVSNARPDEWKKLIGQKPVAARLSTLPENRVRWSALLASTGVQIVLAAILIILPLSFPEKLVTRLAYEVIPIVAPLTEVPVPPKKSVVHAKVQPAPEPEPQPQRVAKLRAPAPLLAPRPKPVPAQNQEAPKVEQVLTALKLETRLEEPTRPREPVQTGVLNTGSAAPITVSQPLSAVQTGGFGTPRGLSGETDPSKRVNVARVGSFGLPPAASGSGNGTGGANGARGTVASAGFGNSVSTVLPVNAKGARDAVQAGSSFATAQPGPNTAPVKAKPAESAPAVQPVVILAKPNPVYSAEARKLGIEGEVLIEVIFRASGQVQTVRMLKGLGHGLDEAAIRAAEQIRFKPAMQQGQAVDFPATVHIVFQLAF